MLNDNTDIIGQLGGLSSGEVKKSFEDFMRGCVRHMICQVMSKEVSDLCGPPQHPVEGTEYHRAGSATGYFWNKTSREPIKRPRVRKKGSNGKKDQEIKLESYEAAQNKESINEALLTALKCGVSGTDQKKVFPEAKGISSSSVSRLWVKEGAKVFSELRKRDLRKFSWLALMLDGIRLSDELTAIVALGITSTGKKIILDFEIGCSENYFSAKCLLNRITERGFKSAAKRLLIVTDGGKGIRKASRDTFKGCVLQRCLVHKERNVNAKLSNRHRGELSALFKELRISQGIEDAKAAELKIKDFLEERSKAALDTFNEAGEELLAFFNLNVPSSLNTSLLSTNIIENSFNNVRRRIGRVKRWRPETDQPQRWLSFALITAEEGFRTIKGYRDLDKLKEALDKDIKEVQVPINKNTKLDKEAVLT